MLQVSGCLYYDTLVLLIDYIHLKVGFCLINGDWMLTHTWSASALQSLLALFGGASAKLASLHDVSSAQDDTICQGLYWLRRALLRLN